MESGRTTSAERLRELQSRAGVTGKTRIINTSVSPPPRPVIKIKGSRIATGNKSDATLTPRSKAAGTAVSIAPEPEVNEFKSLVTEYGRSIIKSAMDHEPEEAATLKNNIVAAKEKVIVKYKTVENELQIAEGDNLLLKADVAALQEAQVSVTERNRSQVTTIEVLQKQLKDQEEQRKRWTDMYQGENVKRKALEVELRDMRRDRKRKRESVAAVWEEAENVKLN
jgi:hypothetical protein